MTAEQTYLALLRSALWGTDMPVIDKLEELLDLADRQKTRALIYELLLRNRTALPQETARQTQRMLFRILNAHRVLDSAITRTVSTLQESGIPCVLLKGQGVARYYPDPRLRECGDVDLYIGPERLEDAVRALVPVAERVNDQLRGKHWELMIDQVEVELHQYSMLPETRRLTRLFREEESVGLTHDLVPMDFNGVSVNTPADTFNAFYLFYHAWHHFINGGIGFRQLCDWTLLLHARQEHIDRTRLRNLLEKMRLLGPWQLFGCIAVHDLGLPEKEFPFYEKKKESNSRRAVNLILSEGNFGHGVRFRISRPKAFLASKLYSLALHFRRFFLLLRITPAEAVPSFRLSLIGGIRRVFLETFHRKRLKDITQIEA